jgi:hypothetical protein
LITTEAKPTQADHALMAEILNTQVRAHPKHPYHAVTSISRD